MGPERSLELGLLRGTATTAPSGTCLLPTSGRDAVVAHLDFVRWSEDGPGWLEVGGWVVGLDRRVKRLAVYSPLAPRHPLYLGRLHSRPDVSSAHQREGMFGFRFQLNLAGLPPSGTLYLVALFGNEERGTGKVRLHWHQRKRQAFARLQCARDTRLRTSRGLGRDRLNPVYVTSLGRSGSTILSHLLGSSKQVFCYEKYPSEARITAYWLHLLRMATSPSSPGDTLGERFEAVPSRASTNPFLCQDYPGYVRAAANARPAVLAAFSSSMRRELQCLADQHGSQAARARWYVEKCVPGSLAPGMASLCFPQVKEVLLVRDPLTWIRSLYLFNRRRTNAGVYGKDVDRIGIRRLAARALPDLLGLCDYVAARSADSMMLRYEDLMSNPGVSLQQLADYLGLDDLDAGFLSHSVAADHITVDSVVEETVMGRVARLLQPIRHTLGYGD